MRVLWLLIGIALSNLLWLSPAKSSTLVWRWISQDDSICWTNVQAWIPAMYREQAVERVVDGLDDYEKYTPIQKVADVEVSE